MFNKLRRLRGKAVDRTLDDAVASLSVRDDPCMVQSRLLALPSSTLDSIYAHLPSRDALCLSATCKQAYPRRLAAYVALQFHFRTGLYGLSTLAKTLCSVRMLSDLLCVRPEYCVAIRSISISDSLLPSNEQEQPGVLSWSMLFQSIDNAVAYILSRSPNVHTFTWILDGYPRCSSADRTIQQLKNMASLRRLSLVALTAPPDSDLSCIPAALEHVVIRYGTESPCWSLPFFHGNVYLRVVHLDATPEVNDPAWLTSIRDAAVTWRNMHTLIITGTLLYQFRHIIEHCVTMNCWPSLRTVSLGWPHNPLALSEPVIHLHRFPICRLRLELAADPSLEVLAPLLRHFYHLQELVLDRVLGAPYAPHTITADRLGPVLRLIPKLRILTVFSLYFLDLPEDTILDVAAVPHATELEGPENQSDDDEEEDDDAMDVDSVHSDDSVASLSSAPIDTPQQQPPQEPDHGMGDHPFWLRPCYNRLAISAENFLDKYLRKPNFQELRILLELRAHTPRDCRMIRFGQVVEHIDGDGDEAGQQSTRRESYMIKYLGVMEGKAEDDAFFWLPHEARRAVL